MSQEPREAPGHGGQGSQPYPSLAVSASGKFSQIVNYHWEHKVKSQKFYCVTTTGIVIFFKRENESVGEDVEEMWKPHLLLRMYKYSHYVE